MRCLKCSCKLLESTALMVRDGAPQMCGPCVDAGKTLVEAADLDEVLFKPRNDNCLVRLVKVEEVRGIAMPQISHGGKAYFVVAVGPKVEGLRPGDRIFMTGVMKVDWDFLPNSSELLVIRESNILLYYREDEEGRPAPEFPATAAESLHG